MREKWNVTTRERNALILITQTEESSQRIREGQQQPGGWRKLLVSYTVFVCHVITVVVTWHTTTKVYRMTTLLFSDGIMCTPYWPGAGFRGSSYSLVWRVYYMLLL